ncbi:MAG: aldehyde dehydrogenase family protein [Pyrinomonadaceae bacterium]|nr:aldehyde dehydrogenase family protein [Phycisphaerales bacterium]
MTERLEVSKTYKLFIDGKFPRSESGRTIALVREVAPKRGSSVKGKAGSAKAVAGSAPTAGMSVIAHVCRASRKDLRDAVVAARKAQPGWASATAYLRGQILYRMAEMLEGKRDEFVAALSDAGDSSPAALREVQASIDRLVHYAGWADKYAQVLGCNNPVAGPFYNFTVPEPTGVVAVVSPDSPGLLGMVSLLAPAICSGNAAIVVAGESNAGTLAGVLLAEVCATSDVPSGVVNILTGLREELVPVISSHRDIDAVHAGGISPGHAAILREGAAENLKRVVIRDEDPATPRKISKSSAVFDWFDSSQCESAWWIEPLVNMKTIWHPAAT